jgi:hypothetical protein
VTERNICDGKENMCDGKDILVYNNNYPHKSNARGWMESIPKCGIVSTVTVFTDTISYDRDGKDNHTFNLFHLASEMTLSTVKGVIFNLVHLIYVGSCYYKPKYLYRHTCFLYCHKYSFPFFPISTEYWKGLCVIISKPRSGMYIFLLYSLTSAQW